MNKIMLTTLWLATYPITNIYLSPISLFSWGDLLFMFLLCINDNISGVKRFYYPSGYMLLWGYLAVTFFLSSLKYRGGSISAMVPGGIAFFIFSLQLGYCSKKIDINLFYKYSRNLAVLAIIILCLQELSNYIIGKRFSAIIPFFNLTDGKTAKELISIQLNLDRSCSIFREPAHIAQFLIIPLILDLFYINKDRLVSKFTIFMIFAFLMARSGNGLLALSLILSIKVLQYNRIHKGFKYKFFIVLILLVASVAILYYVNTENGSKILSRTSEFEKTESSKSYIRIYRGFDLFSNFSTKDKVIGINNADGVFEQTKKSNYYYLFSGEKEEDLYFNCISRVLIFSGLIGFSLLMLISINLFKNNSILGRVLLFIFFVLSFVGQIYVTPLMLTVYVISTNYQYKNKKNENCILHKTGV